MTSAPVEHFAAAQAHEHELNERQRRVLDLLVQGKTNGEVAAALGITLDGAKWNVSEILGKLGLATREEAADYWRWRNRHGRGVLRALRGLAGPAALKWAAGGVAAVAVAAIAVGFFANQDSKPAAPGEFYLEARVEVVDRSRTVGTNIAGATPAADDAEVTVSTLRWWSKDRDHARWEIHRQEDGGPTVVTTIVVDGTWQWVYSSATNTYSKSAIPELPDSVETRRLAVSVLVGPADVASKLELMDGFRDGESFDFVREAGTGTVLGRKTTVIELGPVSRSSTNQGSVPLGEGTPGASTPQTTETSSGVIRIWLDEERMVVMRYVVEDSPAEARAEVVQLDWNVPVPARRLVFDPPPGATFVQAETGRIPASSHIGGMMTEGGTLWYTTPPGFFKVAYAPDTMRAGDYETEIDANNQPAAITTRFTGFRSEMTVAQMRGPGPLPLRDEPMEYLLVGGAGAFLADRAGDTGSGPELALATRRDGVNITITAHGLSREEVIAVAEGLELVR
jgi:outer membrane lipoprotein-sorting protein/DNA-binding CsgD family transcriptional regulator